MWINIRVFNGKVLQQHAVVIENSEQSTTTTKKFLIAQTDTVSDICMFLPKIYVKYRLRLVLKMQYKFEITKKEKEEAAEENSQYISFETFIPR